MRYFTVEEAAGALPEVGSLLRRLRALAAEAAVAKAALDALWERLGAGESVLDELRAAQQDLASRAGEAAEAAERLEAIGCVLRDVETGLVDFPSRAGGGEIFLCWRLGEDGIAFWHGTAEGYAGRKPLAELPEERLH